MNTLTKKSYDFVVVGGGIIGLSTAWQLAKRQVGASILLLEQNSLTSGTTWHAAGLIGTQKLSKPVYEMAQVSRDLYRELEGESGVGWQATGSLGLARDEDELRMLNQMKQLGKLCSAHSGREDRARMVSPEEIADLHPFLDTSGLVGGIYTDKQDGVVNPSDVAMRIAGQARQRGVEIEEQAYVNDFHFNHGNGRLESLTYDSAKGKFEISADKVVLAAGSWTKQLVAQMLGHRALPVGVVPHQYLVFEPRQGVDYTLPVVRDYRNKFYLKPEAGGCFALGIFEGHPELHLPAVVSERIANGIIPRDASSELYEPDLDKMEGIEKIMELVPALSNVGIKSDVHGPDTHSADHSPVMGQLPETGNVFVATGFNSQGIQCGAGAGLAMAEWVLDGHPQSFATDFTSCDVVRFSRTLAERDDIVTARAFESYGTMFQTHYPQEQFEHRRGEMLKLELHDKHEAQNAVFTEAFGWERPVYYLGADEGSKKSHMELSNGMLIPRKYSYDKKLTQAFEHERKESLQCRQRAVVFDLSAFGKLHVKGRDALDLLEKFCTNRMNQPDGSVIYTFTLNEAGGVLADFTVCRLADDEFYVVTYADQHILIENLMKRFAVDNGFDSCTIENNTLQGSVLGVMGPDSRAILSEALDVDFSDQAFPEYTAKELPAFGDTMKALRVSFVGTLGWELHIPTAITQVTCDRIFQAAERLGVQGFQFAGTNALMESLRIEKKFIHYGQDVSPRETPLDIGMKFACKLKPDDPDFVGKDALLKQAPSKMLVTVVPDAQDKEDISLWGSGTELVYRNDELVGYVTSGGYSHTADQPFGLALLDTFKLSNKSDQYEIEIVTANGVQRFPVRLTKKNLLSFLSLDSGQAPSEPEPKVASG